MAAYMLEERVGSSCWTHCLQARGPDLVVTCAVRVMVVLETRARDTS